MSLKNELYLKSVFLEAYIMFLEHFELMFGSEKKTHLRSWENYEKQLKPYRIYNFITSIILNAERCKIAQLVSGRQQFLISTDKSMRIMGLLIDMTDYHYQCQRHYLGARSHNLPHILYINLILQ